MKLEARAGRCSVKRVSHGVAPNSCDQYMCWQEKDLFHLVQRWSKQQPHPIWGFDSEMLGDVFKMPWKPCKGLKYNFTNSAGRYLRRWWDVKMPNVKKKGNNICDPRSESTKSLSYSVHQCLCLDVSLLMKKPHIQRRDKLNCVCWNVLINL